MSMSTFGWENNYGRHRTKVSLKSMLVHVRIKHSALNADWFKKYVSHAFGKVGDSYVAEFVEREVIELLGKPFLVISDEER